MEGNLSGEGFPFFGLALSWNVAVSSPTQSADRTFSPISPLEDARPSVLPARKQQSFPAARSWFPPPFPELPADREGRMGGTSPAWKSRKYGNREKRRGGSQRGEGHSYCFFWGIRHSLWLFHPRSTLRIRPFIWFSH